MHGHEVVGLGQLHPGRLTLQQFHGFGQRLSTLLGAAVPPQSKFVIHERLSEHDRLVSCPQHRDRVFVAVDRLLQPPGLLRRASERQQRADELRVGLVQKRKRLVVELLGDPDVEPHRAVAGQDEEFAGLVGQLARVLP